jgi:hypothetical protein
MLLASSNKQTMASFKIDDILRPRSDLVANPKYSIWHIINSSKPSVDTAKLELLRFNEDFSSVSDVGDLYTNSSKCECKDSLEISLTNKNVKSFPRQKKHGILNFGLKNLWILNNFSDKNRQVPCLLRT